METGKISRGNVRIIEEYAIIPPAVSSMKGWSMWNRQWSHAKNQGARVGITDIFVPIHTNYGCYEKWKKIIRCAHWAAKISRGFLS